MTTDDALLAMLKVKNCRKQAMDVYTFLNGVGNSFDNSDPDFKEIREAVYECVLNMDRAARIVSHIAATKARVPDVL